MLERKEINDLTNTFSKYKDKCPILICGDRKNYNAMMINWGGFGYLWHKKVAFIFVRKDRYTYQFSEKYDTFSLSFIDLDNNIIDVFGSKSGKDLDKFKATNKELVEFNNFLYIKDSSEVLTLKKVSTVDLTKSESIAEITDFYKDKEYHVLYICEIIDYLG